MRFSLEWLASYLPGDLPDAKTLAARLTAAGFISEGVAGEGASAVLDIEITANRPDAMNHRGLAREAALALGRRFVDPEASLPVPEGRVAATHLASVTIVEPRLCSRFSARVIEGIRMGPSSKRIQERL